MTAPFRLIGINANRFRLQGPRGIAAGTRAMPFPGWFVSHEPHDDPWGRSAPAIAGPFQHRREALAAAAEMVGL